MSTYNGNQRYAYWQETMDRMTRLIGRRGKEIGIGMAVVSGLLVTSLYARHNINLADAARAQIEENEKRKADNFKRKPPMPEPIITPKEAHWPGDVFSEKGIDLPKRIEDAKSMLKAKLASGKDKYPVTGLPLGTEGKSGLTVTWLAALDINKNKIELIRLENNGGDSPKSTTHDGFSIRMGRANGANSDFEVVKPPNYVVLAIKTNVFGTNPSPEAKAAAQKPRRAEPLAKKKPRQAGKRPKHGPDFFRCTDLHESGVVSIVPVVYAPYQPEFSRNKELVQKGAAYLQGLTTEALGRVSSANIAQIRNGVRALSPELLFTILIVERIDPSRFISSYLFSSGLDAGDFRAALEEFNSARKKKISFSESEISRLAGGLPKVFLSDTSGKEYMVKKDGNVLRLYDKASSIDSLIMEVLATAGANGPKSFTFAVSKKGARGIGQLMPDTYCGIYDLFSRSIQLDIDFLEGSRQHDNTAVFQALIGAEALEQVRGFVDLSDFEQKVVAFAASYNGGWPTIKEAMRRSRNWAGDYRTPWLESGSSPEINSLKNKISYAKSRIDLLRRQLQQAHSERRLRTWNLELRMRVAQLAVDTATLGRMRREFEISHPRYLEDAPAKYIREAAAIIDLLPELRQKGLFSQGEK